MSQTSRRDAISPPSVLQMLARGQGDRTSTSTACPPQGSRSRPIADVDQYICGVQRDVDSGRVGLNGRPWICPPNPFNCALVINEQRRRSGEPLVDALEALNLVLRPTLFLWSPEKLQPGLIMRCPCCHSPASSVRWWRPRNLHALAASYVYVTVQYTCKSCSQIHREEAKSENFSRGCARSPDAFARAFAIAVAVR